MRSSGTPPLLSTIPILITYPYNYEPLCAAGTIRIHSCNYLYELLNFFCVFDKKSWSESVKTTAKIQMTH